MDTLPLTLLTGFLGSGKTTLLRRALTDPAFSDTAVIINEIGEMRRRQRARKPCTWPGPLTSMPRR